MAHPSLSEMKILSIPLFLTMAGTKVEYVAKLLGATLSFAKLKSMLWASALVAKKTTLSVAFGAAVAAPSIWTVDMYVAMSVHGTAAVCAVIGSICRWIWLELSRKEGLKGLIISPILGVIFARSKPPAIEAFIGKMPEEIQPMVTGFLIGMFGLFLFGYVQDFITAFKKKSGGTP